MYSRKCEKIEIKNVGGGRGYQMRFKEGIVANVVRGTMHFKVEISLDSIFFSLSLASKK